MKIVLDQVQRDGDRYVAYVQLQDDSGVVLATASAPYTGDTAALKSDVMKRFDVVLAREAEKQQAAQEIAAALASIDVEKEMVSREK
jgi:hypothetical protein